MQNEKGKNQKVKQSAGGGTRKVGRSLDWWHVVAEEEKAVIRDVLRVVRGLKLSKSPVMARAAAKWERSIAYFIKWQLQNGAGRARKA